MLLVLLQRHPRSIDVEVEAGADNPTRFEIAILEMDWVGPGNPRRFEIAILEVGCCCGAVEVDCCVGTAGFVKCCAPDHGHLMMFWLMRSIQIA